tara:strand:+ start:1347 stop:1451 length:105 start_codon:yes stop_codon:yes gene_type:complete
VSKGACNGEQSDRSEATRAAARAGASLRATPRLF